MCWAAPQLPSSSQMNHILQLIGQTDNGLACNLSSLNPALLLAAGSSPLQDMDEQKIVQELSTMAGYVSPEAKRECSALHLSSSECYQDCVLYNHPITVFEDPTSATFKLDLAKVFAWYSMSASPLGWYDVGNPDQCSYFGGQYCYTPLTNEYDLSQHIYPQVYMPHGCCVPASCVGDDAVKVVSNNAWCFKAFDAAYSSVLSMLSIEGVQITAVCEIPARETNSFGFVMVVFVFSVFVGLVLVASALYQYNVQFSVRIQQALQQLQLNEQLNVNDAEQQQQPGGHAADEPSEVARQALLEKHARLKSFSIQGIWASFVSLRSNTELNFLDGIRVLSMSWVVLGHSFFYYLSDNGSNTLALAPFIPGAPSSDTHEYEVNKFSNIFIQYAFYSVDSFFWLSGVLGAYSMYRSVRKLGSDTQIVRAWYKWLPMSYLTRYLRLAPIMFFVTAIEWKVLDQLPSGPHTLVRGVHNLQCGDNWWKILLMSANLWMTKDNGDALSCMGHLWYVQCDWWCFMLLPLLVLIFIRNKKIGIFASLVPFTVCLILRFYFGFYYQFSANVFIPPSQPIHDGSIMSDSYMKPWARMAPYFIGVTLMFVMITINEKYQQQGSKFALFKSTYFIILGVALFTLGSLVMWPYDDSKAAPDHRWSSTANAIYYALCRPMWGVGLSLFAFALRYINDAESKQISIIKHVLSYSCFQVIGKLTYCMYLVHLMIYGWWAADTVQAPYYTGWFITLLFIGVWCLSAVVGFVLHIFVESPMNNLVQTCLKKMRKCECCKNRALSRRNDADANAIPLQDKNDHDFQILHADSIQEQS